MAKNSNIQRYLIPTRNDWGTHEVSSERDPDTKYAVDLNEFWCECPWWQFNLKHHPEGSPKRLCKHQRKLILAHHRHELNQLEREVIECMHAAQHCADEFFYLKEFDVAIGARFDNSWVCVFHPISVASQSQLEVDVFRVDADSGQWENNEQPLDALGIWTAIESAIYPYMLESAGSEGLGHNLTAAGKAHRRLREKMQRVNRARHNAGRTLSVSIAVGGDGKVRASRSRKVVAKRRRKAATG